MREWAHDKEIDEHERLEAQLVAVNGALSGAIRRHDALSAEHARVCNEYALLVQESGREGRELDRLEGLLRAWGTEAPNAETYHRREEAVYAEAVRLAKRSEGKTA